MLSATEQYVVDAEGNRVGVVLDIAEYQWILEELEELEALRAYDAAKAAGDEAVPSNRPGRDRAGQSAPVTAYRIGHRRDVYR